MPVIFYSFLLAALVGDLLTKALATAALTPNVPVDVVPFLFSWRLTANDGVAFGMGLPGKNFVTVLLIAGLFAWWRGVEIRKKRGWVDAAFGLMLGGALGNGFERLAYGSVTDFMDLKLFVCNVADVALTAGVVLLAGHEWMVEKWRAWFPAPVAPQPAPETPEVPAAAPAAPAMDAEATQEAPRTEER
jgi:signal peptidase II